MCKKQYIQLMILTMTVGMSSVSKASKEMNLQVLPDEIQTKIFSYFGGKEIGIVGLINTDFRQKLSSTKEMGKYLRNNSKINITINDGTDNGRTLFLEEFLNNNQNFNVRKVDNIENLAFLASERPTGFIKTLPHIVPKKNPELNSAEDLQAYSERLKEAYQNIFQIEDLINSVPTSAKSSDKLAWIVTELFIRTQIVVQVLDQISDEIRAQIGIQFRVQAWDQVSDQIRAQIGIQFRVQVWNQVWAQVRDQLFVQINENLRHFQFASAYQNGNFNRVLKLSMDYTFMVYQLGSIAMRHTQEMKDIHSNLSELITERMTNNDINAAVANITIPENGDDYLLNVQLELLRRYLQTDS